MRGWLECHVVGAARAVGAQRAAHNLFHGTRVQIDARPEQRHRHSAREGESERESERERERGGKTSGIFNRTDFLLYFFLKPKFYCLV